ncbi:MAG: hypothetical protein P1U74_00935 [Legionellaceae bacterium]|nr:hypothetical protein [Legionellaceae bacterium]
MNHPEELSRYTDFQDSHLEFTLNAVVNGLDEILAKNKRTVTTQKFGVSDKDVVAKLAHQLRFLRDHILPLFSRGSAPQIEFSNIFTIVKNPISSIKFYDSLSFFKKLSMRIATLIDVSLRVKDSFKIRAGEEVVSGAGYSDLLAEITADRAFVAFESGYEKSDIEIAKSVLAENLKLFMDADSDNKLIANTLNHILPKSHMRIEVLVFFIEIFMNLPDFKSLLGFLNEKFIDEDKSHEFQSMFINVALMIIQDSKESISPELLARIDKITIYYNKQYDLVRSCVEGKIVDVRQRIERIPKLTLGTSQLTNQLFLELQDQYISKFQNIERLASELKSFKSSSLKVLGIVRADGEVEERYLSEKIPAGVSKYIRGERVDFYSVRAEISLLEKLLLKAETDLSYEYFSCKHDIENIHSQEVDDAYLDFSSQFRQIEKYDNVFENDENKTLIQNLNEKISKKKLERDNLIKLLSELDLKIKNLRENGSQLGMDNSILVVLQEVQYKISQLLKMVDLHMAEMKDEIRDKGLPLDESLENAQKLLQDKLKLKNSLNEEKEKAEQEGEAEISDLRLSFDAQLKEKKLWLDIMQQYQSRFFAQNEGEELGELKPSATVIGKSSTLSRQSSVVDVSGSSKMAVGAPPERVLKRGLSMPSMPFSSTNPSAITFEKIKTWLITLNQKIDGPEVTPLDLKNILGDTSESKSPKGVTADSLRERITSTEKAISDLEAELDRKISAINDVVSKSKAELAMLTEEINHLTSQVRELDTHFADARMNKLVAEFISSKPFDTEYYHNLWDKLDDDGLVDHKESLILKFAVLEEQVNSSSDCLARVAQFKQQFKDDVKRRTEVKLKELNDRISSLGGLEAVIDRSVPANKIRNINAYNNYLSESKTLKEFLVRVKNDIGIEMDLEIPDLHFSEINLKTVIVKDEARGLLNRSYSKSIFDFGQKKFVSGLTTKLGMHNTALNEILDEINYGIKNFNSIMFVSALCRIKAKILEEIDAGVNQERSIDFDIVKKNIIEKVSSLHGHDEYKAGIESLCNSLQSDYIRDPFLSGRLLAYINILVGDGKSAPSKKDYDRFKDKFLAQLHSEDHIMLEQDRGWSERKTTIILAVMTLGLAIAASYAVTKLATGSAYLFWETTKKQDLVNNISKQVEKIEPVNIPAGQPHLNF